MATPEGTYTTSSSVVTTRPRTREEVREELREDLRLVDMNRLSPEDKLRLERDAVAHSVGDVEMFEKTWRKARPESITEIQRAVDRLGEPSVPDASPVATARPTPMASSVGSFDVTPAPSRIAAPPRRALARTLTPAEQRALAKHLGGSVQRAQVLFTTTRGRVVEVTLKKGQETRTLMVVLAADGQVATVDEIGAKLDGMPAPARAPGAAAPPPPEAHAPDLGPTAQGQAIEDVEGIGPAYGAKLRAAGVETVEDLLASEAGTLSGKAGIPVSLLLKWQAMGKLQAIHGVGAQYSELLVRAGVSTLEDVASHSPESLARKVNVYEDSLDVRVQGNVVTPEITAKWVEGAKALLGADAPTPKAAAKPAPAAAPEEAEEADEGSAEEAEAPAPKKRLGLGGLGRGKAKAPKEAKEPGDAPKKKFGLKFGKK